MKNIQLKRRYKIMILSAVQLAIILIVFFIRINTIYANNPVLIGLCDGFVTGGAIYLIWAVVSLAISKGGLDGLFYICRITANLLAPEKSLQGKPVYISYHDFLQTLEHRPGNAKLYALIGGISFAVSLILYLLYYIQQL